MSVIFMDSFQHYVTADIGKKWSSSDADIATSSGRRGGKALSLNYSDFATLNLPAALPGLIVGTALNLNLVSSGDNNLMSMLDGGTAQISISALNDGTIQVKRGTTASGTVLGSSAPNAVPVGSWFYIEVSAVIHDTAGAITVKVNGTTVINLTSVDTKVTANEYVTQFRFAVGSANRLLANDFYIIDPATAPNTTFLGDVRVDAYYPTTDGASSQWTPTPSGAHYATVDETAPNGTDEIEADVTGYIDLFGFQDLAVTPGAFYAVQVCAAAIKTDAGSRQIKSVVRRSAVNYAGTGKDVSETQRYVLNQWQTDPSTAVAWTKAGFDAAEFGVELV